VHDTRSKHITLGERLMPQTPSSAAVKLAQMHIAFAFALAPVTLGSLALYVLASNHLISYWWLAVTLGWVIVPLAILVRALRYARRIQAARPRQPFSLAQRN
jgi:membrane protein YdbS with pleckstrin-like domain